MLEYYNIPKTKEDIFRKAKNKDEKYKITKTDYEDGNITAKETKAVLNAFIKDKVEGTFYIPKGENTFSSIKSRIDKNRPVILETGITSKKSKEQWTHAVICYRYYCNGSTYTLYVHDPAEKNLTYLTTNKSDSNNFNSQYSTTKYSVVIKSTISIKK